MARRDDREPPEAVPYVFDFTAPGADLQSGSVREERAGKAAVVSLRGVLRGDEQPWSLLESYGSDVMSLRGVEMLSRALDAAEDVGEIVYDLDGLGTYGNRLFETMAVIRGLKTPTTSFVTQGSSGFGFLALMADKVVGTPGAEIGSLNTRVGFRERLEDDGMRFESESQLKADEAAGEYTARVKKNMRNRVAKANEVLRRMVAEARGLSESQLEAAFSGQTFVGQQAVEAGLMDGTFPTLDAFLASLQQEDDMSAETRTAATAASPPPGATDDVAPGSTAHASVPEVADAVAESTIRRIFGGFFGREAETPPPSEPAKAQASSADVERIKALESKVATLEQQAEAERRSKIAAQVAACQAIPADARTEFEKLAASADPKVADEVLGKIATIQPARIPLRDFPVGTAGGSSRLVYPPDTDPAEMAAVEAAKQKFKDDPEKLKDELERIFQEGIS